MGWLDRIARRLGYAKTAQVSAPAWMLDDAERQRWSLPDAAQHYPQADLYRRLSWIQIAVGLVARTAATTPFSVSRRVGETRRDITNHPLELLLHRPNPLDSRFELLEATVSYKRISGNAYWWLNRRSADSPIMEIWPIPPQQMQPIPDGQQYLRGYAYWPEGMGGSQGAPYILEPWEVVHFRTFNPLSRFVGLSPIEAIQLAAEGDAKQQEYSLNFYGKDNAKVPGILAFADPIPDPDWARLKKEIQDQSGGVRRSLMMLRNVGRSGVSWVATAMSQRDMAFLEARQFTKEEIFGLFAPGLSSMIDPSATEASAIAGKATFIEQAVWPDLVAMGEKISNDVLPAYGRNLSGQFDDIRVTDRQMALSEQEAYERTHTIDEVRERYYSDPPIGDDRGKELPAQAGSATPPPPPPPAAPADPAPALPDAGPDLPDAGDDLVAVRASLLRRSRPATKRTPGEDLSDDERALFDLLRPILARAGDEILDQIIAGQAPDFDALSAELRDALVSAMLAVALSALQASVGAIGIDLEPDTIATAAAAWAEDYAGELIAGLDRTTRQVVATAVATFGRTPGMTRAQLEALLSPAFGPVRAEAIAITETTRAAEAGTQILQRELAGAGVPLERVWRALGDELMCPICGNLNGLPESQWPAERRGGPPAHVRCRCSTTLRRMA